MLSHHQQSTYHTNLLTSLLLIMFLSGCQQFPLYFSATQPTESISTNVSDETLALHQFSITKEQGVIGKLATLTSEQNDSLPDIARHYGLGFNDVSNANPELSAWTPQTGSRVLLPARFILPDAPRKDIVLNLANMRMFYYPKNDSANVYTYPVGIGREGWSSPIGQTKIISKTVNPTWTVPASIHQEHAEKGDKLPSVINPGPENPLGKYAMRLAVPGYLIHGTNKPYGIGLQVSHGCIQLYPEDIESLFDKIRIGTSVNIVHQPYLVGWDANMLYLEANSPLQKWANQTPQLKKQLLKRLQQIGHERQVSIDWDRVESILEHANGIPTPIIKNSPTLAELTTLAPQLKHPEQFYQQPIIEPLENDDWALLVASFNNETEAQTLAAMLNHQGPIIPARKVHKDKNYYVIAGPFKDKSEMQAAAKRIKLDFELKPTPLKPLAAAEKFGQQNL